MSGGGGTKTVTTQSATDQSPWAGQTPYLQDAFFQASQQQQAPGPDYYPGQTVADTPHATQYAQQATIDAANRNAGLLNQTVNGDFLSAGNPYFQGMVDQIGRSVRPTIDSAFASSGRLGSGAHAAAMASALTDQAGKLAYQNYGAERQNQIAAAQDYSPYGAISAVGGQQEAKQNQYLQDAATRWDYDQNKEAQKLRNYMDIVGNRSYGGSTLSTQVQPYQSGSGLLQGAGTVFSGLGALGSLGMGATGLKSLWPF